VRLYFILFLYMFRRDTTDINMGEIERKETIHL